MIIPYRFGHSCPEPVAALPEPGAGQTSGWLDLFNPTAEEDAAAERILGVSIPTREEAQEIETSSRFFVDEGATFLNLALLVGVDAGTPALTPFSFVLRNGWIATVRYAEPSAFRQFHARAVKPASNCITAIGVVTHLTESIIDRAADIVEKIGADIDKINSHIFQRHDRSARGGKAREKRLSEFLEKIAYQNDIISKSRESLISIERMLQFLSGAEGGWTDKKVDREKLRLMGRDVRSLTDQLSFLSSKATFLLDATLGLISVQQNDVIRVFTVVATILLPPTLIGTLYGMNFTHMPELDWAFGYPLAIGVMVVSALVPYFILKRRGWF